MGQELTYSSKVVRRIKMTQKKLARFQGYVLDYTYRLDRLEAQGDQDTNIRTYSSIRGLTDLIQAHQATVDSLTWKLNWEVERADFWVGLDEKSGNDRRVESAAKAREFLAQFAPKVVDVPADAPIVAPGEGLEEGTADALEVTVDDATDLTASDEGIDMTDTVATKPRQITREYNARYCRQADDVDPKLGFRPMVEVDGRPFSYTYDVDSRPTGLGNALVAMVKALTGIDDGFFTQPEPVGRANDPWGCVRFRGRDPETNTEVVVWFDPIPAPKKPEPRLVMRLSTADVDPMLTVLEAGLADEYVINDRARDWVRWLKEARVDTESADPNDVVVLDVTAEQAGFYRATKTFVNAIRSYLI